MPMFGDAHISSLGYLCQNMLTSQRLTDITIFVEFFICNSRLLVQTPPQPNTKFSPHFFLNSTHNFFIKEPISFFRAVSSYPL